TCAAAPLPLRETGSAELARPPSAALRALLTGRPPLADPREGHPASGTSSECFSFHGTGDHRHEKPFPHHKIGASRFLSAPSTDIHAAQAAISVPSRRSPPRSAVLDAP